MNQATETRKESPLRVRSRLSSHPWLLAIYGIGLLGILNLGFWAVDALWRFASSQRIAPYEELPPASSWLEALFLNVPSYTWFLRAFVCGISLLTGLIYVLYILRQERLTQAVYERERRYRVLFENAPIGLGVATLEGRLLEYNTTLQDMRQSPNADPDSLNISDWYAIPGVVPDFP